jgi:hypothetical protein
MIPGWRLLIVDRFPRTWFVGAFTGGTAAFVDWEQLP